MYQTIPIHHNINKRIQSFLIQQYNLYQLSHFQEVFQIEKLLIINNFYPLYNSRYYILSIIMMTRTKNENTLGYSILELLES